LFPCCVPRLRAFLLYWWPVFVWMALIFSASSDSMSFQHSSHIIGPFVRWLLPGLSEHSVHAVVFAVRKCAHVTEYAILALVVWRALQKSRGQTPGGWLWSQAFLTLAVAALYAATDEFHQRFVPSRQASLWDVLLDTSGAALALVFLWIIGRWRKQTA